MAFPRFRQRSVLLRGILIIMSSRQVLFLVSSDELSQALHVIDDELCHGRENIVVLRGFIKVHHFWGHNEVKPHFLLSFFHQIVKVLFILHEAINLLFFIKYQQTKSLFMFSGKNNCSEKWSFFKKLDSKLVFNHSEGIKLNRIVLVVYFL